MSVFLLPTCLGCFISFLAWSLWLELAIQCCRKVISMGILVSFLFKYLQLFTVEYDVCYRVSYMAFIVLRYVPSMPTLLRIFIDWIEFTQVLEFFMFQKHFLHLLRWSCDLFSQFIDVVNIDSLVDVELSSHLSVKSCLIMMSDPLHVLLNLLC